jgi:hypothetical protein
MESEFALESKLAQMLGSVVLIESVDVNHLIVIITFKFIPKFYT